MAYIYKIINDINQKIYIGKTEFSIEKRFREHCKDAFRDRNEKRPLYAAMRKYGIEHFHISLIEETDNPEEREKYWIEYFSSFKNGYNATLGGDGKRLIDYNVIIQEYQKGGYIKDLAKKLHHDESTILNILRQNNIPIRKNVVLCKPVEQYDTSGQLLNIFVSYGEAARYIMSKPDLTKATKIGTITNKITECANGKRKTAYTFIWKFK